MNHRRSVLLPALLGAAALFVLACGDEEAPATSPAGPWDPVLQLDLADVYYRHERFDEADAMYREVAEREEDTVAAGRAAYGRYLVAVAREDDEAALAHLERSRELGPAEGRPARELEGAALLRRMGRRDEAEAAIENLLGSECPAEVRAAADRELVQVYDGRIPELVAKLETRLAAGPEDLGSLALLGDLQAEYLGAPDKAIEVYERLLQRQPDHAVLVGRLFDLSLGRGDFERAVRYARWLEGRAESDRDRFEILHRLADAAVRARQFALARDALSACRSLVAADRAEEVALSLYAVHKAAGSLEAEVARLEEAGGLEDLWLVYTRVAPDPEKALAVAEKMVAAAPESAVAHLRVVDAAGNKGDAARVVEAAEKLLDLEPGLAALVAFPYAAAMRATEKSDQAVERLQKVAESTPKVRAACALAIAGLRPAEQAKWFDAALAAARELGDPRVRLDVARALREGGFPDRALECVRSGPSGPELEWERILCLEALGRLADAEDACRELAGRAGLPPAVGQAAERKLLELIQRQGKRVEIQPRGR